MHSLLENTGKWFVLAALLVISHMAQAQTTPGTVLKKVLDGAQGQLAANTEITLQDSAYFDPAVQSKLDTPYPVRNIITFKINEYSLTYMPTAFNATASLQITYTAPDLSVHSTEQSLSLNYNPAMPYTARNSFVFNSAHKVTVKVLSVTNTGTFNAIPVLMVENQMEVHQQYKLSCTDDAVKTISINAVVYTDSLDEITASWPATVGADVYDLEWAYIDASALQNKRYGDPLNPELVFKNNATRVTIAGNSYAIPLFYDNNGTLFCRVRAVQEKTGNARMETAWSSNYSGGVASYVFPGHQRNLNWQSNIAFAEEGKRKVVVDYFDGSLMKRQTVSKDNTTNTTIVAETFYDQQARPVIQVMPAPTLSHAIRYTTKFNRGNTGNVEYDKSNYDYITTPAEKLTAAAKPMGTVSGANQYYSPDNPEAGIGINRFIPDAEGYAFTEIEYTSDNTGRISRQGGVGPTFKLGSNHESKFFYGTPSQEDLDALFGTEVGDMSHYFKNTSVDPNGQYAVTYLDMHGRTIATALAGTPDSAQLDPLEYAVPYRVNENLIRGAGNRVKDLVIESRQSKTVTMAGDYDFKYHLQAPTLAKPDCEDNIKNYRGLYDLQITITDDVNNLRLGGKPFDTLIHNFQGFTNPATTIDCNFTLHLERGSYEITKKLIINQDALAYYRDSIFAAGNLCTTLEQFVQQQRNLFANTACIPDCKSCVDSLGAWETFRNNYIIRAGITEDTASYTGEAWAAYKSAQEACAALCNLTSEADNIRSAMLLDVSAPSGQYANVENSTSIYSIFYQKDQNTLPVYKRNIVYLDENGKPDKVYDETADAWVIPQLLKPEQFAAQFKASWADALLLYHPEYCKLLKYESYGASHTWDLYFGATETYAAAKDSGFLNPVGDAAYPFPVVTARRDPFVTQGADAAANLENIKWWLDHFNRESGAQAVNMWSAATIGVMCNEADGQACFTKYATPALAFSESALCVADRDMAWRAFRDLYLQRKRHVINYNLEQACKAPANVTAVQLFADGKTPQFMSEDEGLAQGGLPGPENTPTKAQAEASGNTASQAFYADNCQAYAKLWAEQLGGCYTQADLDVIIPRLVQVCKEGSDVNHPYGSSSVKPSSTYTYRSFQEVLDAYNLEQGKVSTVTCNSEVITSPKPYNNPTSYAEMPTYTTPASCECEKLNALNKEYSVNKKTTDTTLSVYIFRTRGVVINQTDLNQLLSSCNETASDCKYFTRPVAIPTLIKCEVQAPCVPCKVVDSLYTAYMGKYSFAPPALVQTDSLQQQYNRLFANYMNNRLGFNKQAIDYLVFRDSCSHTTTSETTVCVTRTGPGTRNKTYLNNGTDEIYDMIRLSGAGGYVLAGNTTGSAETGGIQTLAISTVKHAYLVRTDTAGNLLWAKRYDDDGNYNGFNHVRETPDGGLVAIGTSYTGVANSYLIIIKTDASGNLQWSRKIGDGSNGGDRGLDVTKLSNGRIAYAGLHAYGTGNGADYLVGVLDSLGNSVWTKRIGTTNGGEDGLAMLADNDTLVVSGLSNARQALDGFVIRLTAGDGQVMSSNLYDVTGPTGAYNWFGDLQQLANGYRITFLNTSGYTGQNVQGAYIDIHRNGSIVTSKMISRITSAVNIVTTLNTSDGGMLILQNTNDAGGHRDAYLHKTNAAGQTQWSKKMDLGGEELFFKTMQEQHGDYRLAGILDNHAVVIRPDSAGNVACNDSTVSFSFSDALNTAVYNNIVLRDDSFAANVNQANAMSAYNVQTTTQSLSCGLSDSCYNVYNGPLLCGNASPVFTGANFEEVNNCSDADFFAISTGTDRYNAYRDSLYSAFERDYINSSLGAQETFTVEYENNEYHYTLYYYDQAGNLVKTVPPAGVVIDRSTQWLSQVAAARAAGTDKPALHNMKTNYRYNTLNGVVTQNTPDAGTSRFWYDRLGRLAISQNAQQLIDGRFSYTSYDPLGRIIEVGRTTNSGMTNEKARSATQLAAWLAASASTNAEITHTYYDESIQAGILPASNLRNRVAWTAVYDNATALQNGGYAFGSLYSYDILGNVETVVQDFKFSGLAPSDNRLKKIVYSYDLVSGKVNEVAYQPGARDAFYHRYRYDAENRLTNVETSRDGVYWDNDAFYRYYQHGPLARAVIGQQQVQGVDYAYNLQGWMKGVNSSAPASAYDMGGDGNTAGFVARDAFGFGLHYFGSRDYKPVSTAVKPFADAASAEFRPLFNGNIATMNVSLPSLGVPLLYGYKYDVLNRLKGMKAMQGMNTANNTWSPVVLPDFKEDITYDPNGNILTYNRNGNNTFAGKPLGMDSLNYTYKTGTNKLDFVNDQVNDPAYGSDIDRQLAGNYQYDAIGNLISDAKEKLQTVEWTVYGKIAKIRKYDNSVIEYGYDAGGNRVWKKVGNIKTWYVRDATGNVLSLYTEGDNTVNDGKVSQVEAHLYGSSRLGIHNLMEDVTVADGAGTSLPGIGTGKMFTFARGHKFFELSNHLGNVLATVSDRKLGMSLNGNTLDHYEAEITSAQDYYPFGMLMPGRNGHQIRGGFATGSEMVNGHSVPEELSLVGRDGNQPKEYAASRGITFLEGFGSSADDDFAAVIADGTYSPVGGEGGAIEAAMSAYRYGFNGKENDNEVKGEGNQIDFGNRVYDSRLGRFLSVDRLTAKVPFYSPYIFAGNKPISAVDVDGDLEVTFHYYREYIDFNTHKLVRVKTGSHSFSVQTAEDIKGIIRSRAEFNVVFRDVGVEYLTGQTTYVPRFHHIEAVAGTGETRDETMQRTEGNFAYYAYKMLLGLPHEKIGFALLSARDSNGELLTAKKRALDVVSGTIDLFTMGRAGTVGGNALGKTVGWMLGDFAAEEGMKYISKKFGLSGDQEMILTYHFMKLALEKKEELIKLTVESVLTYSGLSTKLGDYLLQKFGVDINAPKDKDEAVTKTLENMGYTKEKSDN